MIRTLFERWYGAYGLIKIEEWPEGLVVWVGGRIRYKSWECSRMEARDVARTGA